MRAALGQAERLIDRDDARAAIELLQPLAASHPQSADLHGCLGHARAQAGDIWAGIAAYERALELSADPGYWAPLAMLYLQVEMRAHALRAFRQVLEQEREPTLIEGARHAVDMLQGELAGIAGDMGLAAGQFEEGMYHMEAGQCALHINDLPASAAASRQAIRYLHDWPPPHNNLSLALFYAGQPQEAIATARRVLAYDPHNVQALSNAIRFLAWTGQEEEARTLWAQLGEIVPQGPDERLKIAEAAATLDQDERVYELLKPLDRPQAAQDLSPPFIRHVQRLLAVAEANTGRPQARWRLQGLQADVPWAGDLLAALQEGKPGPGWAARFPYFQINDFMAVDQVEAFVDLIERQDKLSEPRFRRQVKRFAARFPQIVRIAEKMIWEEGQAGAGVGMLSIVGTPAAHAALRRFGLSQAGEDDVRMRAITALLEAGQLTPGTTLRLWLEGEWHEVQLGRIEVSDEPEVAYDPQVAALLDEGLAASQQGDEERAERLFQEALALDAQAKEALNNLGAIYARRGEHDRAREAFQAALAIDPRYVFPLCNLASYRLDEGDVAGAKEMLQPLASKTHFRPLEMAFSSYTQARIMVQEGEYDGARRALETALQFVPDYKLAQDLLQWLDRMHTFEENMERYERERQRRERAARARLQAALSVPDPALSQALALYTRDVLTGMARIVLPWGGWSTLRKGELAARIADVLASADGLDDVVGGLSDAERAALGDVLHAGGTMPWAEFDARYGNDLQESPYWNYHSPETAMGRLRERGLLVETTVDDQLRIAIPRELRQGLLDLLKQ